MILCLYRGMPSQVNVTSRNHGQESSATNIAYHRPQYVSSAAVGNQLPTDFLGSSDRLYLESVFTSSPLQEYTAKSGSCRVCMA